MTAIGLVILATAAGAHEGVKNPKVMAWMAGMKDLGAATKTLVKMASGQSEYQEYTASAALEALSMEAAQIADLFAEQANDPKSDSLPAIWSAFDDFTNKAAALEASVAAADVSSLEGVQAAVRSIGGTCSACHMAYRK